MTAAIEKSIYLSAPRQAVWTYLTDAKKLGTWFHPSDTDMVAGATYTLSSQTDGERMCWGTVEESRPHDYLRWSFTVGPANGAMSTVEWRLEEIAGGTRLSLSHSGLPDTGDGFGLLLALDKGWHGFLMNLRQLSDDTPLAEAQPAA
ncbi:SRPBCC domain-containing protein [Fluviibacterium sp. DFM31]|uniref:SRPBCC domain-containing protein n=1 Tax=Meridianimarinicoccus marinus TaxID=3231483 RepID=A0ABV3LAK6_9RHOB